MKLRRIITAAIAAFALVGSFVLTESAYGATWTGRNQRHGYFDNKEGGSCSTNDDGRYDHSPPYPPDNSSQCVAPVLPHKGYSYRGESNLSMNAAAIMAAQSSGGDKAAARKFVDLLRDTYNNNKWSKTGVAYIVDSMLGRDPNDAGTDRNVSGTEFNDLEDRLVYWAGEGNIDFYKSIDLDSSPYNGINTFYQRYRNDVAYYNDANETHRGLVVYNNAGKPVYALWYYCGNPLGNLSGVPPPVDNASWSVKSDVYANVATAQPGDTIQWRHRVTANGPNPTDQAVTYRFENRGDLTTSADTNHPFASGQVSGKFAEYTSTYTVQPGDAGKNLCRRTASTPRSSKSSDPIYSGDACVSVGRELNYDLTPKANLTGGGTSRSVEPEQGGIGFQYGVENAGPDGSSDTDWEIARCTFGPGAPASAYGQAPDNTSDGAATYNGRGGNCGLSAEDGTSDFPRTYTQVGERPNESVGTLAVGSRLCIIISVRKPTGTSPDGVWRHSMPACVVVLKTPKIQAWGGDIKASTIRTSPATNVNGRTYGSWAEYGIFNYGNISGMGSASVFAGGCANNCLDITRLTFANTTGARFMEPTDEGYIKAYRDGSANSPGGSLAGLASGSYTQNGNLSTGGAVAAGTRATITVTGDLRITSDIAYPATYGSATDVPRIVFVVDGNIIVDANVGRIDAWLISKKTLYTCSDDSGPARSTLNVGKCANKLTFNGPVYVNDTRLSRTYGADATSRDDAAEVFNLRPDVFISSFAEGSQSQNIQTVYEKELPPRY